MKRRSRGGIFVFVAIFFGIIGSAHFYMATRLVLQPSWGPTATTVGVTALAGLCLLLLTMPFAVQALSPRATRPIAAVGYTWMGVAWYLLVGLWLSEIVMLVGGFGGQEAARTRALVVLGGALSVSVFGIAQALRTPAVKRVEVALPRWPRSRDGYRIVQMSDIHIGALLQRPFAQRIVDRANGLAPDMLAITGDVVDGRVHHLEQHVAPFGELRAQDGVYFATGNHDHYAGASAWTAHFRALGMRVLENEHEVVGEGEAAFVISGVTDRSASPDGDDVGRALSDADAALPRILLAHHPQTFAKARHHGVDLQLSGHTHGGQMWPFTYLVNLQTRWVAGLYRLGEGALYVSRGTGFWGPPMRVLAPAEITELVLRAAPEPAAEE